MFFLTICFFLTSCSLGVDTSGYKYPDEGQDPKGNFIAYNESVSFLYPEKYKVIADAEVKGNHYSYTIEDNKSQASIMNLNVRKVEKADSVASGRHEEIGVREAIDKDIHKEIENIGYRRFTIGNIEQETIESDGKNIYMTKCVLDLDPQRILLSYYN